MGRAARARGTFEERKAAAIKKKEEAYAAWRESERQRLAAMTPKEKERRNGRLNTTFLVYAMMMQSMGGWRV